MTNLLKSAAVALLLSSAILIPATSFASFASGGSELINTREDAAFTSFPGFLKGTESLSRMHDAIAVVEKELAQSGLTQELGNAFTVSQRISTSELETTKFQHYFKGIEVIGSMAFHHRGALGTDLRNAMKRFDLDISPSLSAEQASGIALSIAGDRGLSREPELKILPNEDADSAQLVYWVHLPESGLDGAREIIIDAHNGEVIANLSKQIEIAPVQVFTAKNQGVSVVAHQTAAAPEMISSCDITDLATGRKETVDGKACNARLKSQCQIVLDGMPISLIPSYCKQVASNGSAKSGADASAKKALENSVSVYNYYQSTHGRNSYDNLGSALVSVVHAGVNYANAHWDTEKKQMAYGDGNPKQGLGDFTAALDVAGHEMTHGVISQTAKLLGMGDSGALNEAFADFFGKMVDFSDDWAIGRKLFLDSARAKGVRDLANPKALGHPAHMKEKRVAVGACDESNDRCYVHVNATIPGRASYLVTKAIGKQKAEKLYYAVMTQALGPRDNFKTMADSAKTICKQLFDKTTCQSVAVAFGKVGL